MMKAPTEIEATRPSVGILAAAGEITRSLNGYLASPTDLPFRRLLRNLAMLLAGHLVAERVILEAWEVGGSEHHVFALEEGRNPRGGRALAPREADSNRGERSIDRLRLSSASGVTREVGQVTLENYVAPISAEEKKCLLGLLTLALQAGLQAESEARHRRIDEIAQRFFESSDPERNKWALESLVAELKEAYVADGVTLFLEEDDLLLPAASTDPRFASRSRVSGEGEADSEDRRPKACYGRGKGLTGWVFEKGESLRIRDDEEVIRRRLGLNRSGPSFEDYDESGPIVGQFLAAPLRMGSSVVGVIRVSRRSSGGASEDRFSKADEETLQHLADLLGSAFSNWQRAHLAAAILESISEGIAVSRRQFSDTDKSADHSGTDKSTDHIVFANPGIASMLQRSREEVEGMQPAETYSEGELDKLRPHLRQMLRTARSTGRAELGPVPSKLRRADGSSLPVMIS